ncbi:protein lin-37 homolog [Glossina fuscipes]|uniref:Protein lin-37 homolog n=1 Tax=Glossina fuscipes TaxID=7396 RepID=A0A9C5YWC3_9MUSC|nr:protein lin-37 homolog [Glossina fuscipes]
MKTPPQKRKQQTDVQAARGRLRGALKDTLDTLPAQQGSNDEAASNDETERRPVPPQKHGQRGRPPKYLQSLRHNPVASVTPPLTPSKKRKRDLLIASSQAAQKIQAESFVMKLFDRSLDLSKYSEQTPLYPICRAWMANQPRNPSIRSFREKQSPAPPERKDNCGEILSQLKSGELKEVISMPKPKKADIPKIPPQNLSAKSTEIEEFAKVNDKLKDASQEELLVYHLSNWKQIKRGWQKHTRHYQQRNDMNFLIIKELLKH